MTRYICVTSAKGGVGKTTTAVNLASSMTKKGADSLLVDGNISAPNVHVHLGNQGIDKNLHDAIHGLVHVAEVIYRHNSGLRLVPTITTIEHLKYPHYAGLKDAMMDLDQHAEIIIIDSAPGLGKEAIVSMEVSDEILLITTPDNASIEASKQTIQVVRELGKTILGVVLNKVRKDRLEHSVEDVEKELGYPVIAIVPHDDKVRSSWKKKHPVVHSHPKSNASKQFFALAELLLGPKYTQNLRKEHEESKETWVLGQLGMK